MPVHRQITLKNLLLALAAPSVLFACWRILPDGGRWSLIAMATGAAFLGGLFTSGGLVGGLVMGAAVIITAWPSR